VFDKGRIIEDGSHAKLLALGGAYHRLWKMQAGGFLPENLSEERIRNTRAGADNFEDFIYAKLSG
jgi:ATP-binding cassette, subfamily B, bacterial